MEEKVKALVLQLGDIVRKQTKGNYPDVNEALRSLQDYLQERTAFTSGLEDRLNELDYMLATKSEKKKPFIDQIEKIRRALGMQRRATPKVTMSKEEKRKPSSPASSERTTPLPSKTKQTKTLRYELTQTDEATELSGTIDENEEQDIRRLKTENQYLKKTLDGLHKYIIGGDERALNELKTPKHMTDNQSIVEVEANVKEVTQKFHETQTETRRLQMENKYMKLILDDLHKSVIVGEATLQMELKPPKDIKNDKLLMELTANTRKIHLKFYELETELYYIHRTISQLTSMIVGDDRRNDPIQERTIKFTATGRQPKRNPAKTFEQREQSSKIDKDIELVTSVWRDLKEKEMDAKNAIKERECLLLALDCLFKHLRDLSEGTTEGDISSTLDQIKSSINKDSSVNQGLSHARAILNIDMEWKRDIRRLKTENQYLKKTLDGLHEYIIGGDETALNELKTPKHMTDNQSIVEVEANVKEVTQKFHETKTNAENVTEESKCLFSTMECLINHVRGLSEGNTEGDISSALDQIKPSVKKGSPANQFLTQAKEIIGIQMEWKREAEYATHLIEELNERLVYDGKQDTQIGLKEPPVQMARASSKHGKKGHKKQNDEKPKSRHSEQLQSNFSRASNVLKMLMKTEESIAERKCLLSTLKCLCNYVRDLFEGKTEAETSPSWDEIWSSVKKESSANQGLSHAKEILSYQMEWKREAEYASNLLEQLNDFAINGVKDRQVILKEPVILMAHDSRTDAKKDSKKQTDQSPRSRHVEQLQRNFSSASKVLEKQMLSEHAGALLTFENPSISDLSDPNRPTKLSEMYSELYDNKWTDAFANLEKVDPDISEKKIVGYLYDMLVDGYRFCENVRRKQILALEDILFDPAGGMKTSQRRQKEKTSTIFAKHLSDVAKLSSNVSSVHMAEAFVMEEKTKDKYSKVLKPCETYIQECVQLCWLMQVQTPPLCLDLKTIQGEAFDKNCYREYTKKGKKIAFVVWPALFLHESGPLLSRGVAQCQ